LRILKEAENGGFLDQVLSGFEAFVQDPAGYTSQAMGSVVPNLVLVALQVALRLLHGYCHKFILM
jgi:hypothetical protein